MEDYRLPEHLKVESRMSRMKIDTKALMGTSRGLDLKTKITTKVGQDLRGNCACTQIEHVL